MYYEIITISLETFGVMLGILCLWILRLTDISSSRRRSVYSALFYTLIATLLIDLVNMILSGMEGEGTYLLLRIGNCVLTVMNYMMAYQIFRIQELALDDCGIRLWRGWNMAARMLCVLGVVIVLISQVFPPLYFSDYARITARGSHSFLGASPGVLLFIIYIILLIRYRKAHTVFDFLILFQMVGIPMLAAMIQLVCGYGISLLEIGYMISVSLVFLTRVYVQGKKIQLQRQELQQTKLELMWSQIKPHFLYNILNSIYVLVDVDSRKAKEAISDFSDYLRNILESYTGMDIVSFERELGFVKNYLELEKIRFGDELKVEYRISDTDFMVPPISIQPLVENAVKHGISKKRGGGTVRISAFREGDHHVVSIDDDGAGFDVNYRSEGTGIGIDNVRKRLKIGCGADLFIESEKNKGTHIRVCIPSMKSL